MGPKTMLLGGAALLLALPAAFECQPAQSSTRDATTVTVWPGLVDAAPREGAPGPEPDAATCTSPCQCTCVAYALAGCRQGKATVLDRARGYTDLESCTDACERNRAFWAATVTPDLAWPTDKLAKCSDAACIMKAGSTCLKP